MRVTLDKGAFEPTRAHATDAGLDLYSPVQVIVCGGQSEVIDTGVHIELPKGHCGMLISKSGLNVNYGLTSTGLIDEGYTGPIKVKLYNHSESDYLVKKGDKISQLVVFPVSYVSVELAETLSASERGNSGFGSTGK